jgi:nuclear pore complex protein Nup62
MYVCVCIYVCTYYVHIYVCTYKCMCVYVCTMYVCIYVCTYVCVCMYVYVYIFIYIIVCIMYVCMGVCMYLCMYGHIYVCTYVCIYECVCVCAYLCVYVRMYVCMYVERISKRPQIPKGNKLSSLTSTERINAWPYNCLTLAFLSTENQSNFTHIINHVQTLTTQHAGPCSSNGAFHLFPNMRSALSSFLLSTAISTAHFFNPAAFSYETLRYHACSSRCFKTLTQPPTKRRSPVLSKRAKPTGPYRARYRRPYQGSTIVR